VVAIWEGIGDYFADGPNEIDFVPFSNYGRQVDGLISGIVDMAWNTNLAWVRTVAQTGGACRALATRDMDLVFQTIFVARAGSGMIGLESLRGRRLALGSTDSAQAAILPVQFLQDAGLGESEVELSRINSDVGEHGDAGRSELDALRAVLEDRADAAAIGINTWEAIGREQLMPGALEAFWVSPNYSSLQLLRSGPVGRSTLRRLGGSAAGDGLGQSGEPPDSRNGGLDSLDAA
jgi:phosphonate transport system substrate-binding protein